MFNTFFSFFVKAERSTYKNRTATDKLSADFVFVLTYFCWHTIRNHTDYCCWQKCDACEKRCNEKQFDLVNNDN